jgi:hypothetical protein
VRTLLGITGVLLGLVIVTVLSTSWIVVYVHQKEEGWRLVVPAPVFLADIALRIGGAQAEQIDLPPEARQLLPMIRPIVDELSKAPDFEMVHVEQPDVSVSIRKVGQHFEVSVVDADETVHVVVPLAALQAAAQATEEDGRLRIGELAGALRGVSHTKLVDVRQADQDVGVWIW